MTMEQFLALVVVGLGIGIFGTLIGAGGGFILMPLLLIVYPQENPELLTSISLAVVFFNALSGTVAYARMKRIDYRSGILFSLATVPGAILGALSTSYIPRRTFNVIFGLALISASLFLFLNPRRRGEAEGAAEGASQIPGIGSVQYNTTVGVIISLFVGFASSVLGIGGGIIHVPALIHVLNFPVHIATATSHFILSVMSFTGTAVHAVAGDLSHGIVRTVALAVGAVVGAQIGARLSNRVHGTWIVRGLATALAFVGIRLLTMAL